MRKPFVVAPEEAIAFLRDKLDVPTATWTDVWQAMHDRAFTVAGAQAEDLVEQFHQAVLKAIEEGLTLEQFRESFDEIVAEHGWSYHGSRNWRRGSLFGNAVTGGLRDTVHLELERIAGKAHDLVQNAHALTMRKVAEGN